MLVVGGYGPKDSKMGWGYIESTEIMLPSESKKWTLVPTGKTPTRYLWNMKVVTLDNTLYMVGKGRY